MSDPMIDGAHTLKVVELKSPGLPLRIEPYRRLEDYPTVMRDRGDWQVRADAYDIPLQLKVVRS